MAGAKTLAFIIDWSFVNSFEFNMNRENLMRHWGWGYEFSDNGLVWRMMASFCSLISILRLHILISLCLQLVRAALYDLCFYGNWHVHYFSYTLARLRQQLWLNPLLSSIGCKNVSGFPTQHGNQLRRWVSRWGLSKKRSIIHWKSRKHSERD